MIQFISGEAECSVNKCSHFNSPDESACPGPFPGSDRPNYLNTSQQRAFLQTANMLQLDISSG